MPGQIARHRHIQEEPTPAVDEEGECLHFHSRMPDIGKSVIVYVAKVRAHSRHCGTICGIRHASAKADLFKAFSAQVMKQKVGHRVIGNEGVQPTVAVKVSKAYTHALTK